MEGIKFSLCYFYIRLYKKYYSKAMKSAYITDKKKKKKELGMDFYHYTTKETSIAIEESKKEP